MKKLNSKIGIRIFQEQKKAALLLVGSGKFKNLSEVVRTSMKEFLSKQGGGL